MSCLQTNRCRLMQHNESSTVLEVETMNHRCEPVWSNMALEASSVYHTLHRHYLIPLTECPLKCVQEWVHPCVFLCVCTPFNMLGVVHWFYVCQTSFCRQSLTLTCSLCILSLLCKLLLSLETGKTNHVL